VLNTRVPNCTPLPAVLLVNALLSPVSTLNETDPEVTNLPSTTPTSSVTEEKPGVMIASSLVGGAVGVGAAV